MVKVGEKYISQAGSESIVAKIDNEFIYIYLCGYKYRERQLKDHTLGKYLGLAPLSEFLEAKEETYESVAKDASEKLYTMSTPERIAFRMRDGSLVDSNHFPKTILACAKYLGLEPDDLIEMVKLDQGETILAERIQVINNKSVRIKISHKWRPLSEVLDEVGVDWEEMYHKVMKAPPKLFTSTSGYRVDFIDAIKQEAEKRAPGIPIPKLIRCASYLGIPVDDVVHMVEAEEDVAAYGTCESAESDSGKSTTLDGYRMFDEADFPKPDYDHYLGKIEPPAGTYVVPEWLRRGESGLFVVDEAATWGLEDISRWSREMRKSLKEIGQYEGITIYSTKGDNMYRFNDTKFKAEYRKAQVEHDPEGVLEKAEVMGSDGTFCYKSSTLAARIQTVLNREGKAYTVENIKKVFDEYVEEVEEE